MTQLTIVPHFDDWQRVARQALRDGLSPEEVSWNEIGAEQPALAFFPGAAEQPAVYFFPGAGTPPSRNLLSPPEPSTAIRVPRKFIALARSIALHSDETRWALLYRILWRLTRGKPKLLEVFVDADVAKAFALEKSVRHDIHKMRAFVRFREVNGPNGQCFVAWFEPAHHIVEHNAQFFVDRFASMRWSILTPRICAHWDGEQLSFTAGVTRAEAPREDEIEPLWLTYYSNIFNPARVKVHAMQAEMPKRYWRNLPESVLIPSLLNAAPRRVDKMVSRSVAQTKEVEPYWSPAQPPPTKSLEEMATAAKGCTACYLHKLGTQTVFGEGRKSAELMLVGEQPGDQEDLAGKPFVGPAGKLLDRALEEAGIDRKQVYVTNTVKHFKWEPRGKRRIHQKPNSRDIAACRPWLEAELALIKPKLLVCLGSTAAQAILGPSFRVTKQRGEIMESPFASRVMATVHPSSLLRQPDEESRQREYGLFVKDLRIAANAMGEV